MALNRTSQHSFGKFFSGVARRINVRTFCSVKPRNQHWNSGDASSDMRNEMFLWIACGRNMHFSGRRGYQPSPHTGDIIRNIVSLPLTDDFRDFHTAWSNSHAAPALPVTEYSLINRSFFIFKLCVLPRVLKRAVGIVTTPVGHAATVPIVCAHLYDPNFLVVFEFNLILAHKVNRAQSKTTPTKKLKSRFPCLRYYY